MSSTSALLHLKLKSNQSAGTWFQVVPSENNSGTAFGASMCVYSPCHTQLRYFERLQKMTTTSICQSYVLARYKPISLCAYISLAQTMQLTFGGMGPSICVLCYCFRWPYSATKALRPALPVITLYPHRFHLRTGLARVHLDYFATG